MQFEIDIEQLRTKKLFIATPMYGGQCHGSYTKAISDLMVLCTKYGIEARLFFIFNDKMEAIKYCINRFDNETKTSFLDLYTKIDAGIDPTTVKTDTVSDKVPF